MDGTDATVAAALESVLKLCAEGACDISHAELTDAIAICGAHTPGLTSALKLYTLEFKGTSVYKALNEALRSKARAKCAPFERYTRMLMHAMLAAPVFEGTKVYRGVRGDLRSAHKKGAVVTWPGFTSCTCSLEVQQNEQLSKDTRTRSS